MFVLVLDRPLFQLLLQAVASTISKHPLISARVWLPAFSQALVLNKLTSILPFNLTYSQSAESFESTRELSYYYVHSTRYSTPYQNQKREVPATMAALPKRIVKETERLMAEPHVLQVLLTRGRVPAEFCSLSVYPESALFLTKTISDISTS